MATRCGCRGILGLVSLLGGLVSVILSVAMLALSSTVWATPSHPEGAEPIPLPPVGPSVFPEEAPVPVFDAVSVLSIIATGSDLENLSDGDSSTSAGAGIGVGRARLGMISRRDSLGFKVLGEFVSDTGETTYEAESGDTVDVLNEPTGWRYQLRDAYVDLGGASSLRVGMSSSGIAIPEKGAVEAQGQMYEALGPWSGLMETRYYIVRGTASVGPAELSAQVGEGRWGKLIATATVHESFGAVNLGVAGGLYGAELTWALWGDAQFGPVTVEAEVLSSGGLAWSGAAAYNRSLTGETFSEIRLIGKVRARDAWAGRDAGVEGSGGVVMVHRSEEDVVLTSGVSWSAFLPESDGDAIAHSAVLDLVLWY